MANSLYHLISLLFFEIPLLYYYINLRSFIIFYLLSEDRYLSFGISRYSASFITVRKILCGKVLETYLISSAISSTIKSHDQVIIFVINYISTDIFAHVLSKRQRSITFKKYLISRFN